jgi:L-aminopeptidase/D-esterase-like protein
MANSTQTKWLDALCDVPGLKVGHAQNDEAKTGCTVILPANGAVAGVDVRGSAPGTREIELLHPVRLVPKIHALLLTGGSAFGLDAAGGVLRFLEEKQIGYDTGVARVPIVPAAVIFDLAVANAKIRPDKEMGYQASLAATETDHSLGLVGAGCGATVGKMTGMAGAMPGGIGQASERLGEKLIVSALVVVNAFGDVVDPACGEILAGVRSPDGAFLNTMEMLRKNPDFFGKVIGNTTLAAVTTSAALNKEQCTKVAQMAHDGLARSISPIHTMFDGDISFALSCGHEKGDATVIGAVGAELVARSVVKAVRASNS